VNDFGSINIDSKLVERVEGDTVSLNNGCICCSIREDFLQALLSIVKRPEPPEYLVVETSGISDPAAIVATLADPSLRQALRIDTILAMVDASEFLTLKGSRWSLAEAQVSVADLVAINKVDLVGPDDVAAVKSAIYAITKEARLVAVRGGEVPVELVFADGLRLNPAGASAKHMGGRAPIADHPERRAPHKHQGSCCHGDGNRDVDHVCTCHHEKPPPESLSSAFESWSYETEEVLSLEALRHLLKHLPQELYRLKGIFHVQEESENSLLLQVVGNRINEAVLEPWGDAPRRTAVVAIGDAGRIDNDALTAAFDNCVATTQSVTPSSIVERAMSYLRAAGVIAEASP
jgi:G3E family GTPase